MHFFTLWNLVLSLSFDTPPPKAVSQSLRRKLADCDTVAILSPLDKERLGGMGALICSRCCESVVGACALICNRYRDSYGSLPHILSLPLSKGRGTAFGGGRDN